jgi:peptide/nickel transport system permease protein
VSERARVLIPALVLALAVVAAVAAPVIAPHNPTQFDVTHRLAGTSAAHLLGTDQFGRDVLSRLIYGARASLVVAAVAAPVIAPHNPTQFDVTHRLAGTSAAHLLGTDQFGRDVLSRLIYGARASLVVAFGSATLALLVGTALGLVGGYAAGWPETLVMRAMDVILSFPPIVLALLVVTVLGPGVTTLVFVIGFLFIPAFARITASEVLVVKRAEYVEAAHALGVGTGRILRRTILPNVLSPLVVQYTLSMAAAVLLESGLSFLGLGVVPPTPSWGGMIGDARSVMVQAPGDLLWPCVVITVAIMAMNSVGDGLRDALDPRTQSVFRRRRAAPSPEVVADTHPTPTRPASLAGAPPGGDASWQR